MKKFISLVICSLFLFTGCGSQSYFETVSPAESTEESADVAEETVEPLPTTIFVQVAGAVLRPGVYELPADSRVFQAISAAGGMLEEADDSTINQAEHLSDGQKIYVYSTDEIQLLAAQDEAAAEADDGLVNINTADAATLQTLPGIGASKASNIVEYRDTNGSFNSIEDIKQVSGIGDGIYAQIMSLIKV